MEKPDLLKMEKWEASGKQGKKSSKSKKFKDSRPLTEEQLEKLPKLPKDWKWISHSEIAIINPPKPNGDESLEISFLPMPAVEEETGKYSLSETRKLGEVRKGYTGFIEGDVIFAKITPCMENGKVAYLEKLVNGIGFGSTEFHVSRPESSVFGKYLFHYLVRQTFRKEAKRNMTGSAGQLRVPSTYFAEQPFPLAPLPEQRSIVSKIEQLFSELDNGISNLKLAQEQLKVYRQAVLKKAFEGELTKKWREQQIDLPDSEGLLEKIKKERKEATKASSKKQKPIQPLTEDELEKLPKIPDGWGWAKIGEVLEVFVGSTPSRKEPKFWGGDIPWVSSGEVSFCRINSTKESITKLGLDKSSTQMHPIGTVMLGMIGEGKTRGQVAILNINACHNQNTAAIRVNTNYLSEFVYYFFEKNYNENRRIGSGNNQQALNKNIIENMSIPLCSLHEQKTIVQEIETRLSVCDKIEQDIETNLERAEALRQSILKKAFEGKLLNEKELAEVRGAEDWEPAEVLLEKIKVEKAVNGKKVKQETGKVKSIIQEDKGIIQQATLQAFEQNDK